ncbi:MAG: aconitate hydratase [Nitrospinae bacterium]|nr:aconitate hydratase [Nitrospinota bacterium]
MAENITQKILREHLVSGEMVAGKEIAIDIDQTLTQDATGTMAYLQFEAMGVERVKTMAVSYVDHNTLQEDFKNPDDHAYLRSIAAKYGIYFSRPGNGICHQVHLERFGIPGQTLLGSDSHTTTQGGLGMIAIGAGGLDVAFAMAGKPFKVNMPKVVNVILTGRLPDWVSAKDVILELLRRVGVKGGVGKVFEYSGHGIETLSVPERAVITNMGAETGATTSIFPSDEITRAFLRIQKREDAYRPLVADPGAKYDETIKIDLGSLIPLIALPDSPGNVFPVTERRVTVTRGEGKKSWESTLDIYHRPITQVNIGSCTNSSYRDLMIVAAILKGRRVYPDVSLSISPGSKQVMTEISKSGALTDLIDAGARILEATCGPCIGKGNAPSTKGVSLRTFNRNFPGRSGTKDADVYLVSPEVAAFAAITGKIVNPIETAKELNIPYSKISLPQSISVNDNMIIPPLPEAETKKVEIVRGPNIAPLPKNTQLPDRLIGEVLLKVGDNISTDDIQPAGKWLDLRSNVPAYSKATFSPIEEGFHERARALRDSGGHGFIIGGSNYGQGSSREHAGLCPMFLGIKAVIVKSFARIHLANLINFGIVPLIFANEGDYNRLNQGDKVSLHISGLNADTFTLHNETQRLDISLKPAFGYTDISILKAGGALNLI